MAHKGHGVEWLQIFPTIGRSGWILTFLNSANRAALYQFPIGFQCVSGMKESGNLAEKG
jgi:hypothetical protein